MAEIYPSYHLSWSQVNLTPLTTYLRWKPCGRKPKYLDKTHTDPNSSQKGVTVSSCVWTLESFTGNLNFLSLFSVIYTPLQCWRSLKTKRRCNPDKTKAECLLVWLHLENLYIGAVLYRLLCSYILNEIISRWYHVRDLQAMHVSWCRFCS